MAEKVCLENFRKFVFNFLEFCLENFRKFVFNFLEFCLENFRKSPVVQKGASRVRLKPRQMETASKMKAER